MRRSKSNPAKCTRNYKRVSQRRMTQDNGEDDSETLAKLRRVVEKSAPAAEANNEFASGNKTPQPQLEPQLETILSRELIEENTDGYNMESADATSSLVVVSKKKKRRPGEKRKVVELTPQERRQAQQLRKRATKKLKQLEEKALKKEKRKVLYEKLHSTAIASDQMHLLQSSSTLGKKATKKETLRLLVQKERAGLKLSEHERSLLYHKVEMHKANVTSSHDTTVLEPQRTTKSSVGGESLQTGKEQQSTTDTQSFASQMMLSLALLNTETKQNREADSVPVVDSLSALAVTNTGVDRYMPRNEVVLKTAASLGMKPNLIKSKAAHVRQIDRPSAVSSTRFDLPVAGMEYEVMQAIRNNDVVILCGETGSGKSTQVPQFLYESGFSEELESSDGHALMIGITQPRRVAAVSTAKRVCYEMGFGDGQSIRGGIHDTGNVVAYQTRYETAGIGTRTQIKFMTDGILLQEIQSDLLLRQYSVIVLDEAHQRNLNTDTLVGLLSVALPLRKKAADESTAISPLKVIIMSATLRVEDFTQNKRLFSFCKPEVLRIPGRTHPVTIHHNKVTELKNFGKMHFSSSKTSISNLVDVSEEATFRKVCKIHRNLPPGGILVFLTGKLEIIRMVERLELALNSHTSRRSVTIDDVSRQTGDVGLRGADDDELDDEMFQDFDPLLKDQHPSNENDTEDAPVTVLPLFSMMSTDDQAKVFAPTPNGRRLIVVATNIAETSITIPGVSYVVDCGRQKKRIYCSSTGMSHFSIEWISKAAADQRAGRSGRCGPGHCYRLYSSTMYEKHMKQFEEPEVLSRPLEDVVLAMKAMNVSSICHFPFPTPPSRKQLDYALRLLADLGCLDTSMVEKEGGEGNVTRLGSEIATFPLGVRFGKMFLLAKRYGILEHGIAMVASLSETSPFTSRDSTSTANDMEDNIASGEESDRFEAWEHPCGDMMASITAISAYSKAAAEARKNGDSGDNSCREFCRKHGLDVVVMKRIEKMRTYLLRLAKRRFDHKDSSSDYALKHPTKRQERLMCQALASGLLDNVAMLAPPGSIPGEHPFSLRSVYLSCSSRIAEPLFLDRKSVLFHHDPRLLPKWVCYASLKSNTLKQGGAVAIMQNATVLDPSWIVSISEGSRLLRVGDAIPAKPPIFDNAADALLCYADTKFGDRKLPVPPMKVRLTSVVENAGYNASSFQMRDNYRWFGRFLLEGKVLHDLKGLGGFLNDAPNLITSSRPLIKVEKLVSKLASVDVDNIASLKDRLSSDNRLLLPELTAWIKDEHRRTAKKLWLSTVRSLLNG